MAKIKAGGAIPHRIDVWTGIPVANIMHTPPITAGSEETATDIAEKMMRQHVGSVIIAEKGKPIGIVTDGDLIAKVIAKDLKPSIIAGREIMSKPLRTIRFDDDIIEAAKRLRMHGIKRLGVMKDSELVGVVSMSDISSVAPDLLELLTEKIRMVSPETVPKGKLYSGYCDSCALWSDELEEIEGRFVCEECRAEERELEVPE